MTLPSPSRSNIPFSPSFSFLLQESKSPIEKNPQLPSTPSWILSPLRSHHRRRSCRTSGDPQSPLLPKPSTATASSAETSMQRGEGQSSLSRCRCYFANSPPPPLRHHQNRLRHSIPELLLTRRFAAAAAAAACSKPAATVPHRTATEPPRQSPKHPD